MELLLTFLATVIANVISYYICKWADGRKNKDHDN